MDLAVQTTASPAAIWAIVIVAVVSLAFWLIMVMVVAARPDPRFRQMAGLPGPALGVATARDSVAASPASEAARVPAQREPAAPAEPSHAAGTASATVMDGSSTP